MWTILLCIALIAIERSRGIAGLDFCDNDCQKPGLFCIENNANAYTQCAGGTRYILKCPHGTVWDSKHEQCTFPAPSLSACSCNRAPVTTAPQPWPASPTTDEQDLVTNLVDKNCMECLCQEATQCNLQYSCHKGFCGPFRISKSYFIDAKGKTSSTEFRHCVTNKSCAAETINAYIRRYAAHCLGTSRQPSCKEIARIHYGGPYGCKNPATLSFGARVDACYTTRQHI